MVSRFSWGQRSTVHPPASSCSVRGPRGRWARRPARWKVAWAPRAPATGRRKRRVEPLSPQSKSQGPAVWARSSGVTSYPWSQGRMDAPRPLRHRTVASMSWEVWGQTTRTGRSPKAAQISSRWAADLEGMAANVPWAGPGRRVTVIAPAPFRSRSAAGPRG